MPGVEVKRTLNVPIESLFDVISDHAGYSRFRGIQHSEVVRAGDEETNGLGALRRIHTRPLRFDEEITYFERPVRMDYVIRDVNVPMVHEGGSIRLEAQGPSMTHVHWVSRWRFTTPLWRVLGIASTPYINFGFGRMLDDAARIAAEPGA